MWQEQPTVIKFLLLGSPCVPFCSTGSLLGGRPRSLVYCSSMLSQGKRTEAREIFGKPFSVSYLFLTLARKSGLFVELPRRPVFTGGRACSGVLGLVCFLSSTVDFPALKDQGWSHSPHWAPCAIKVIMPGHAWSQRWKSQNQYSSTQGSPSRKSYRTKGSVESHHPCPLPAWPREQVSPAILELNRTFSAQVLLPSP